MLLSTKAFWTKTSHTFGRDMRVLTKATDKDFEDIQANIQKATLSNVPITTLIGQARTQGTTAVQKT